MNSRFFWRAALIQTVLVGGPFLLLLALPVHGNPLLDWGIAVGPGVWVLGSLATGRLLKLPLALTLVSTLAGGVAGAVIGVAVEHYGALPIAIAVFAASCAGYEAPAAAGTVGVIGDGEAARGHVSASLDDAAQDATEAKLSAAPHQAPDRGHQLLGARTPVAGIGSDHARARVPVE